MARRRKPVQWDLFDSSGPQEMQRRGRELDNLITHALKKNDYEHAKKLTMEQERLIQELVRIGEMDSSDRT